MLSDWDDVARWVTFTALVIGSGLFVWHVARSSR